MKNLLKFEFRKLFKSKAFIICLIIDLALTAIGVISTKIAAVYSGTDVSIGGLDLLRNGGILSSMIAIFLGIFASYDYANGIMKNIYSRGYSRKDVFLSKYISSLVGSIIIYFSTVILAFGLGCIVFGRLGNTGNHFILSFLVTVLTNLSLITLYFSISAAIGRIGLALVSVLIFPSLFGSLLNLFDLIIYANIPQETLDTKYVFLVSDLWLENTIKNLSYVIVRWQDILVGFIVAIVYGVGSFFASYAIVKRKDL